MRRIVIEYVHFVLKAKYGVTSYWPSEDEQGKKPVILFCDEIVETCEIGCRSSELVSAILCKNECHMLMVCM